MTTTKGRDGNDDCPFCTLPDHRIVARNHLAFALRDGYPVNEGHTLFVPRRHVATWFDATQAEQAALMALLSEVRADLDRTLEPPPAGYNIGINVGLAAGQTVMHLHVHLIPRFEGDVDDPAGGVRYVIPQRGNYRREGRIPRAMGKGPAWSLGGSARPAPLSRGGTEDPFAAHVLPLFHKAHSIAILAAFVRETGVRRVREPLRSALERGAQVRVLTGDYLHLTQAQGLRLLLDLQGGEQAIGEGSDLDADEGRHRGTLELRVVETGRLPGRSRSFHPKAWICSGAELGAAFVGSSNLSRAALGEGIEWNLRVEQSRDPAAFQSVLDAYELWWQRARVVDADWLEGYALRARELGHTMLPPGEADEEEPGEEAPEPWPVQMEALERLDAARREEHRQRALVIMATGLGKTWLAGFDVAQFRRAHGGGRVLVLAHRVELLRQAADKFRLLFPDDSFTWCAGPEDDLGGDVVFASVAKLARPERLQWIPAEAFDYVLVDEVHHAHAPTYRRILGHLERVLQLRSRQRGIPLRSWST